MQSFNLFYFDGSTWQDTWDSTSSQPANSLPLAVQVVLAVQTAENDSDGTPVIVTYTRVFTFPCTCLCGSGGADGRAAMNRRRPGIIFITAMWVVVILSAVVLIFARSMRTEVAASRYRFSVQQADAVELGAEQYVLAAVDGSNGDAVTVLQTQAEQIPIGNGFFWILQMYPDNDYTYAFGITDESSKVNINFANATTTGVSLANLPGMPQDVADSIVLCAVGLPPAPPARVQMQITIQSLPRPYSLKASPFESVDELFLVSRQDVTDQLMYGSDMDHNGMLDDAEQKAAGGLSTAFNAASDTTRGVFPFLTAWGGHRAESQNQSYRRSTRESYLVATRPHAHIAGLRAAARFESKHNKQHSSIRPYRHAFHPACWTLPPKRI